MKVIHILVSEHGIWWHTFNFAYGQIEFQRPYDVFLFFRHERLLTFRGYSAQEPVQNLDQLELCSNDSPFVSVVTNLPYLFNVASACES